MFDVNQLREDFPILREKIYGKPLVYLDNGATTQKPSRVVERMSEYYLRYNSNVHRGVHYLSNKCTDANERAREIVRGYIHAKAAEEVIFTRGTTESINLVANTFGEAFIKAGDEIVVTEMEHHANIVPWQMLCERKGAVLKVVPFKDNGELDMEAFAGLLGERVRLVAVAYVSNVLGKQFSNSHFNSSFFTFALKVAMAFSTDSLLKRLLSAGTLTEGNGEDAFSARAYAKPLPSADPAPKKPVLLIKSFSLIPLLLFRGERVRESFGSRTTLLIRLGRHYITYIRPLEQVLMGQIVLLIRTAVYGHRLHVTVFPAVFRCLYLHGLTVLQMQGHVFEVRAAQNILPRARAYRIEAQGREYIPSRSLPIVFITAIAVRDGRVKLVHNRPYPILGFPRLAGIVIKIRHVLYGLVAVSILAHVHNLHFANLMNHYAIIAIVEQRRQ